MQVIVCRQLLIFADTDTLGSILGNLGNESEQVEIEVVGTINRKHEILLASYGCNTLTLRVCIDSLYDLSTEYSSAQHNFKELNFCFLNCAKIRKKTELTMRGE